MEKYVSGQDLGKGKRQSGGKGNTWIMGLNTVRLLLYFQFQTKLYLTHS